MKVTITAPSRLHLGLAGMGTGGSRCFGGVGLAVSHHVTTVTVESQPRSKGVRIDAPHDLRVFLEPIVRGLGDLGLSIAVDRVPPRHCGFGTGTSLRLAVLEGAALVSGRRAGEEELRAWSGRGGGSGVGINSYFLGGLIGDGGHRRADGLDFLPSGSRSMGNWSAPRPIWRKDWPEQWRVAVCYPRDYRRISGDEEKIFFSETCPIPEHEVDIVARALFFELPAALDDLDFAGFRSCIAQSRSFGFKKREVDSRGEIAGPMQMLASIDALAVTMSSLGPAIVIFHTDESALRAVDRILPDDWLLITGAATNAGRSVLVER